MTSRRIMINIKENTSKKKLITFSYRIRNKEKNKTQRGTIRNMSF